MTADIDYSKIRTVLKMKYKTKKREVLLDYFKENKNRHITAKEVCDYFVCNDISVSQATVYRHLDELTVEGKLYKYVVDEKSPACYEYIDGKYTCSYHVKCEKCGKLVHIKCQELDNIGKHLKTDHGFSLDSKRTVFYGLCEDCQESSRAQLQ